MRITEIFRSIQGESSLQGMPCVFVRTSGCNLDCTYCDTLYARTGGYDVDIDTIIDQVNEYQVSYVCITGGEPLLQEEMPTLISRCIDMCWRVSIETNGTIDASKIPHGAVRIIDIKCPGSGESGKLHPTFLKNRRLTDEYKFVIMNRTDFEYAHEFSLSHALSGTGCILLSPVISSINPALLADWICEEWPDARLNLQLHTFIWPDERRKR